MDISVNAATGDHDQHSGQLTLFQWGLVLLAAAALALLMFDYFTGHGNHGAGHGAGHAHVPGMISIVPFVALLGCIAVLPLLNQTAHWWESNQNRLMISLICAAGTLAYFWATVDAAKVVSVLQHAILLEYIPFIMLLLSLYVISGGISLRGDMAAHPATNTSFLAVGALIASFVGTTGASMLLIRPLLQTNSERKHVVHTVIFFIFLVSNIGGCLLPIGDPPLFLGYLKGVPFLWTFNLWMEWAIMCVVLLVVYFIWDTIIYKKEAKPDIRRDETQLEPLRLNGGINFLWLAGVVLAVALVDPSKELPLLGIKPFPFLRELLMIGFMVLSLKSTPRGVRERNKFNYHAIVEVAALFIGIFICMQAPIEILHASAGKLESFLSTPSRFFWATGALSGFLDNAPTYVVFFETANTMTHEAGPETFQLLDGSHMHQPTLIAISLGAVFMGAMTYIGNGPNFMVKSIAEQSGVRMPSFFGFMKYSVVILVPLFVLLTILFL